MLKVANLTHLQPQRVRGIVVVHVVILMQTRLSEGRPLVVSMMYRRFLWSFLGLIPAVTLSGALPDPAGAQRYDQVTLEPIALSESVIGGEAYVPDGFVTSNRPMEGPIRAVVNEDNRTPVLSQSYPWSAIGRVDWVDIDGTILGSCTGTLIGPSLVLTNAHCLIDPETDAPTTYTIAFRPNVIQGQAGAIALVIDYEYGDSPYTGNSADDWALLVLDQPLGETYGYLGWRTTDFTNLTTLAELHEQLSVAGYSADFPPASLSGLGAPGETAGVSANCSVLTELVDGEFAGSLIHSCDTNSGASGAPIFALFDDGEYYILGLHAGSVELLENVTLPTGEETDVLNRGIPVARWAAKAAELR